MNERPTPETDTETMRDEYDHVDTDFGPFAPSDTVPADFARCLERERDEALKLFISSKRARASLSKACDSLQKELRETKRERDEAREENEKLREALLRIRTWGIESKNFSSNDNGKMAHWIDEGCIGNLPKPDGPWIYEKMEAAK